MTKRFEEVYSQGMLNRYTIVVDTETGVNYLCVNQGNGVSITPLLDSEGKPIITRHI